jgi:two-component system chemotaxis response regulator CheY
MAKRVLMVDDSNSMRTMVAFTLRRAGYDVIEAEDGHQAMALIDGSAVDCVVTDINMPGMDGLELIRQLRASPAHRAIPIVLLTVVTDPAKQEEAEAAGATVWLSKPFHPTTLLDMLGRMAA